MTCRCIKGRKKPDDAIDVDYSIKNPKPIYHTLSTLLQSNPIEDATYNLNRPYPFPNSPIPQPSNFRKMEKNLKKPHPREAPTTSLSHSITTLSQSPSHPPFSKPNSAQNPQAPTPKTQAPSPQLKSRSNPLPQSPSLNPHPLISNPAQNALISPPLKTPSKSPQIPSPQIPSPPSLPHPPHTHQAPSPTKSNLR